MDKDVVPVCPVCAGNHFRPYKFELMQCVTCALVVSPDIWRPRANETMEEEWFGENSQAKSSFWIRLFENRNNQKTLDRLGPGARGRRLLEIGVGSGSFLNAARSHGYEVMGCDLSATIRDHVQATYGIPMHAEPVEEFSGDGRFDAIVLNHVLEHVNHPIEFLSNVRRLLAPGGIAHIAVPNVSSWEAFLPGWTSYEPYHLAYFDPTTLTYAVTAGGLKVKCVFTHDSFSGWLLAILRSVLGINVDGVIARSEAARARRSGSLRSGAVEHVYRLTMVCTGVALWPLRVLQSRLGRGDEVICIAYKPQTALRS